MHVQTGHILPTVRIKELHLENFKSIHKGDIVFSCGRNAVPMDTESDILGIYGQNGTGKTSVIEAISIVKRAIGGQPVPDRYSECIRKGAEYAKINVVFDFQYPYEEIVTKTICYSLKIKAVPNDLEPDPEDPTASLLKYPMRVEIFDEVISASGKFNGEDKDVQPILTTSQEGFPIGPTRKIKYFIGSNASKVQIDLGVCQKTASKESKSFIFSYETMELFYQNSNYSEYFQVLMELQNYACIYLYAVDTRLARNGMIPSVSFNTRYGILTLRLLGSTRMNDLVYRDMLYFIDAINSVLPSLVKDMTLIVDATPYTSEKQNGQEVRLFSKRDDIVIPLRDESAGIIKLVGVLSLIIAAFNDRSVTVAVDELDAGVYEYLLGEILTGLETYGKGQFIFTSHNLRPLEVLKKENLVFSTSNPDNRFIRLKGVGKTNNLRSLYLREILGDTQDEQIYDAAKRQRMIASFVKAGVGFAEEK